jgi:hypothetical protein
MIQRSNALFDNLEDKENSKTKNKFKVEEKMVEAHVENPPK